jgi:hypothetical protein
MGGSHQEGEIHPRRAGGALDGGFDHTSQTLDGHDPSNGSNMVNGLLTTFAQQALKP